MNKLLLIFLSIVLFVLLALTGTLLYVFSDSGNAKLQTYIEEVLQEKTGLEIEVRKFTLQAGQSRLVLRINKQANIEIVTHYDLLSQSFQGIYHVKAKNFQYEKILLSEADIQGHFKGVKEDLIVDGRGTALESNLAYKFRVVDQEPKNIIANIKGISLLKVLELAGQPPLAKGKIDVDINMPDIGEEFASGYGKMELHQAYFDEKLLKKVYGLSVPKKSHISGKVDIALKGKSLKVVADAKSNLFVLKIKDALIQIEDKNVSANYVMDVKEVGILTQNKLAGPLNISGDFTLTQEAYYVRGSTGSLGGTLLFDIAKRAKFNFENLEIAKVLHLVKQPSYATGLLSGSADIDKQMQSGGYNVKVEKGQFGAKSIEEHFAYQIPSVNIFSFHSIGKIDNNILDSEVVLKSSLSDMKLSTLRYDIGKRKLETDYDIFLPNIGLLMPNNKAVKRGYMSLKGVLKFDKELSVKGSVKGLGEKLDFSYDGKAATLQAQDLFAEKLLSLSTLPRYVKGKLSSIVKVSNIETLDGTFSFSSKQLLTQPNVMERLIGKKLEIEIAFQSKGVLQTAVAHFDTLITTSMGELKLGKSILHVKDNTFSSTYVLEIPSLEKTYALTDKKLYGPMHLTGSVTQDEVLKITGDTRSLGGQVSYTLLADSLRSDIVKVPLENILGLLGHKKLVQGDAFGTVTYDLKRKVGVVNIDIKSFQIKQSSTTSTVKMFIGKDPARIIYSATNLYANIKGDVTTYTLTAKGAHSTIEVTEGVINKEKNTHHAKFKFVYEKYVVTGSIGGSADNPSLRVDPSSVMNSEAGEKIQKKLDKALGGDMGKAVGSFLKGFKF